MENDRDIYWEGDLLVDGETLQILARVAENCQMPGCFFVSDLRQINLYANSDSQGWTGTKSYVTKDAAKQDAIGKYK